MIQYFNIYRDGAYVESNAPWGLCFDNRQYLIISDERKIIKLYNSIHELTASVSVSNLKKTEVKISSFTYRMVVRRAFGMWK